MKIIIIMIAELKMNIKYLDGNSMFILNPQRFILWWWKHWKHWWKLLIWTLMKKSTLDSLPQDLIFHSNSFSSPTASNHHHQHHRHHTYIVSGVLQHYFDDNHLKTPRIEIQSWALKTKSATNLLLASPWESKNGTLKYFNYLETNIVTNSVILIVMWMIFPRAAMAWGGR